jgi:hypothetical protein
LEPTLVRVEPLRAGRRILHNLKSLRPSGSSQKTLAAFALTTRSEPSPGMWEYRTKNGTKKFFRREVPPVPSATPRPSRPARTGLHATRHVPTLTRKPPGVLRRNRVHQPPRSVSQG